MSYTLEVLDDGHIILLTLGTDFQMVQEMPQTSQKVFDLLESGPDHIVLISDGRGVSVHSLSEIIEGAGAARSETAMRVNKHPKLLKSLNVINSKVLQMAARGLNSASFGHIELTIFETVEDALNAARAQLSEVRKTG